MNFEKYERITEAIANAVLDRAGVTPDLLHSNADNTFTGVIEIQATLAVEPAEADWFIITSTQQTYTGSYGSFIFN